MVERPHGTGDDPTPASHDGVDVPAATRDAVERDAVEMPETPGDRVRRTSGRDVGERARERHAAREPDSVGDTEPGGGGGVAPVEVAPVTLRAAEPDGAVDDDSAEPAVTDRAAGDADLGARAEQIAARLDDGEIDEATHDIELQQLLQEADPTQADPTQAMEIADRIRDPERREWTQAGMLGRYAETQGYSTDDLAEFAAEFETDTGIDGFIAGLPLHERAAVREALAQSAEVPDSDGGPGVPAAAGAGAPSPADPEVGNGQLVARPAPV
ncbi:MAG TPA: hypothetical protein VK891_13465, partial [Euzebyales bacterium]|nr:hypothetical protein [Euzebyales bacterium]